MILPPLQSPKKPRKRCLRPMGRASISKLKPIPTYSPSTNPWQILGRLAPVSMPSFSMPLFVTVSKTSLETSFPTFTATWIHLWILSLRPKIGSRLGFSKSTIKDNFWKTKASTLTVGSTMLDMSTIQTHASKTGLNARFISSCMDAFRLRGLTAKEPWGTQGIWSGPQPMTWSSSSLKMYTTTTLTWTVAGAPTSTRLETTITTTKTEFKMQQSERWSLKLPRRETPTSITKRVISLSKIQALSTLTGCLGLTISSRIGNSF